MLGNEPILLALTDRHTAYVWIALCSNNGYEYIKLNFGERKQFAVLAR